MKRLLLVVVLVAGVAVCAYAKTAKRGAAGLPNPRVISVQDISSVSAPVKTLAGSGVTARETESVAQAAKQADTQGLKSKDLTAKVTKTGKADKTEMDKAKKKAKKTGETNKETKELPKKGK